MTVVNGDIGGGGCVAWTESVSGGSGAMRRYDDIADCGLARGVGVGSYVGGSYVTVVNGDIGGGGGGGGGVWLGRKVSVVEVVR